MSGWSDLAALGVTVRPLSEPRPPEANRASQFSATLGSTVSMLATELRALDAQNVVLEIDIRERDLRVDGLPRADAKVHGDAVAISFDSKFGPLRYATGEYSGSYVWRGGNEGSVRVPGWQANLRAIALSMEALRSVDRYGVSKRGEQYTGWRQLPASTDPADAIQTTEQAYAIIARHADCTIDIAKIATADAIRKAIKATHPDAGGDSDEFRQVQRARTLLAA